MSLPLPPDMDYYAVAPLAENCAAQMLAVIHASGTLEPGRDEYGCYALVDGAFDEAMWKKAPWRNLPRQSLYADTDLGPLGDAAPQLVQLPLDAEMLRTTLTALCAHCSCKPMLSLIVSRLEMAALRKHFAPFLKARTEDGMEWPIRWADTRVLPALLTHLSAACMTALQAPLLVWMCPMRDGALAVWQGGDAASVAAPDFDMLPLDDAGFATLVAQAEPDAILNALHDRQPDVVTRHAPYDCHQRVSWVLQCADEYEINSAPVRHHLAMLSLQLAPGFTQHPAMVAALAEAGRGGDYLAQIRALPESFWSEVAC